MKKIAILLVLIFISILSSSSTILARENMSRLIKVPGIKMTLGELRQMEKRIAQNTHKLGYVDHRYNIDIMFKTKINGKPILTPKKYVENLKRDDKFFANMVKIKERNSSLEAENYALRNEVERLRKRNRELESAANNATNTASSPLENVSPAPEANKSSVESTPILANPTNKRMDNGTKLLIIVIIALIAGYFLYTLITNLRKDQP